MRSINDRYINDLLSGDLAFFLRQVKDRNKELSLEIRGRYINIYYRGGSLLKITQNRNNYTFKFDSKYCLNKGDDSNYKIIKGLDPKSIKDFKVAFNLLIDEMSSWLAAHPKPEREYQHQLLINNPAVVDIEYQVKNWLRLDMLMIKDDTLVIVENKYGVGAIGVGASLSKHYADICRVLETQEFKDELYNSVESIIKCKQKLGLIDDAINVPNRNKNEILFIVADYNQQSRTIQNEALTIEKSIPAGLLFTEAEEYIIRFEKVIDFFQYRH